MGCGKQRQQHPIGNLLKNCWVKPRRPLNIVYIHKLCSIFQHQALNSIRTKWKLHRFAYERLTVIKTRKKKQSYCIKFFFSLSFFWHDAVLVHFIRRARNKNSIFFLHVAQVLRSNLLFKVACVLCLAYVKFFGNIFFYGETTFSRLIDNLTLTK